MSDRTTNADKLRRAEEKIRTSNPDKYADTVDNAVADWLLSVTERQEWSTSAYRRRIETTHALAVADAYLSDGAR